MLQHVSRPHVQQLHLCNNHVKTLSMMMIMMMTIHIIVADNMAPKCSLVVHDPYRLNYV